MVLLLEDIEIIHGDTEQVPASEWEPMVLESLSANQRHRQGLDKVKEKGAKVAAHLLEASEQDLEYIDGKWTVKGTDKSIGFGEVALASYVPHNFPEGLEPGIEFNSFYDPTNFTYPIRILYSRVEVDGKQGTTEIKRFVAVDDVGNVVNPMID